MKHILLTNNTLDIWAGSELYLYNLAREYQKRGLQVTCFTLRPGEVSDRLAQFGIRTTTDLSSVSGVDIIHSHHRLEFKIAAAYFPLVPLVHGSLGPMHPFERPTGGNAIITRHVAISRLVRRNLIEQESIPPGKIDVVPNFIDLERFTTTSRINEKPGRVLLLSNYFQGIETVQKACQLAGNLDLTWIGYNSTPVWDVEKYIEQADIVITMGQGALQAMAMGRAVIVFGPSTADGLVTPDNFENMVAVNFNGRIRMLDKDVECNTFNAEELAGEIKKYNRDSAEALKPIIRENFSVGQIADKLLAIYERATIEFNQKWAGKTQARLEAVLQNLGSYLAFLKEADAQRENIPIFQNNISHLEAELEVYRKNHLEEIENHKRDITEFTRIIAYQDKIYLELQAEYKRATFEFTRLEEHIKDLKTLLEQITTGRVMKMLNFFNNSLDKLKRFR